ncbi:MAG TPA: energy transducer TonB [Hyphomonadaceae bacterium]|nr:energy transducer TonB [Hyphomonadaceae bacterium]
MRRSVFTGAFAGLCVAALTALPGFADIKAFNAALTAGDYKKAAAEAAATWPTLDKSRTDITEIAREFGFVAYVAREYAASRTFAEFAAAQDAAGTGAAEAKTLANVLLRAADYRLKPSDATRDALFGALEARAPLPGFDNISFAGTEAIVSHDLDSGRWKDAIASSELAARLSAAGGRGYLMERRRYELYGAVAGYRLSSTRASYQKFVELSHAMTDELLAAPSDAAAERMLPIYWDIKSWRNAIYAHLKSRGRSVPDDDYRKDEPTPERLKKLTDSHDDDEACRKVFDWRAKPDYPKSALYEGFVGAVILKVDIGEDGKASNPAVLGAVPEKHFAEAVLDHVGQMKWVPGKTWDKSKCSLAETGHVVVFNFQL